MVEFKRQPRRKMKILRIDILPDAREILGQMLMLTGHDCFATYDVEAGIQAAKSDRPDLILLELPSLLKDKDREILISLRTFYAGPIIAISNGDADQAISAGCNYHFSKAEIADLISFINREGPWLDSNESSEEGS
jgi:CheY-like chemotaxis protein